MLAKVIAWAPDPRAGAPAGWPARCARARIHGLVTNRDLLVGVPARRRPSSPATSAPTSSTRRDARPTGGAADLRPRRGRGRGRAGRAGRRGADRAARHPGRAGATWCPSRSAPCSQLDGDEPSVEWYGGRDGYARRRTRGESRAAPDRGRPRCELTIDGVRTTYDVSVDRRRASTSTRRSATSHLTRRAAVHRPGRRGRDGSLLAPMPGTVVGVPSRPAPRSRPARPCWSSRR